MSIEVRPGQGPFVMCVNIVPEGEVGNSQVTDETAVMLQVRGGQPFGLTAHEAQALAALLDWQSD